MMTTHVQTPPDPFIEAARKRIEDGQLLFDELSLMTDPDKSESWHWLPIEAQKFWIDLAASVRASEPIRCETPFIQLPDGTRCLALQEEPNL